MEHVPVLLHEVIEGLDVQHGAHVVDGTAGGGGHSRALCERIGSTGVLLAIDRDAEAVERTKHRLAGVECKTIVALGNYRDMEQIAQDEGIESADAILLDIGMSSHQLDVSGRGFTFQKDEPLKMTMETDAELTAAKIVNHWAESDLCEIFKEFGEEAAARQIAAGIAQARKVSPIMTTSELTEVISKSIPGWRKRSKANPATKVFQALRIVVNDELGALRDGLTGGWELLACDGRFAVISFHSLEDRIVKQLFAEKVKEGAGKFVSKKPLVPGDEEVAENPRSRSAKLRIIQKVHAGNSI